MPVTLNANTSTGFIATSDLSGVMALQTGGTTAMTINTSQNVGIGTTSPTDTAGFSRALDLNGTSGAAYYARTNGSATSWTAFGNFGVDGYVNNRGAGSLLFFNNNAERMRIDSSGNVGIGNLIPGSFNSFANQLVVGSGNTNQGITIYTGSANSGSLNFADGTVGADAYQGYIQYNHSVNAMDFIVNYAGNTSPRMRIDSDGDVGIGTTNPLAKLEVHGQSRFASSGSSAVLLIDADATSTNGVDIQSSYYGGAGYGPMKFTTSGQERMRITSGGFVGINTTSPSTHLTVDTKQSNYTDGIDLVNSTNWGYGTSINFRVPPTSGGSLATVARIQQYYQASNKYGLKFFKYDSSLGEAMNITAEGYLLCPGVFNNTTANAPNVYVFSTGDLTRSTSSRKYKTDIVNYSKGLNEVMLLRPVSYKGINDGDKQFAGLIAEEVEEAGLIEFVQYAEDGTPDGLAYPHMIALLTKAIQELKAELDATKAEVAALKGAE